MNKKKNKFRLYRATLDIGDRTVPVRYFLELGLKKPSYIPMPFEMVMSERIHEKAYRAVYLSLDTRMTCNQIRLDKINQSELFGFFYRPESINNRELG